MVVVILFSLKECLLLLCSATTPSQNISNQKIEMLRLTCQRAASCRRGVLSVRMRSQTTTTTPVAATTATTTTTAYNSRHRLAQEQEAILQEASSLTRSLYRLCMRSAQFIRKGNEHDAADFAEREEKQLQEMDSSIRTKPGSDDDQALKERLAGVISMLPPVNPEAELEARSEYYMQYTSENFIAESDCLEIKSFHSGSNSNSSPDEAQFARYFYHLRKGEEHRTWLLEDMKFEDPFAQQFDLARVDQLEERVHEFLQEQRRVEWQEMDPQEKREIEQAQREYEDYDSDEEAFSDDEDDDDDVPMIRYKNRNQRFFDDEED